MSEDQVPVQKVNKRNGKSGNKEKRSNESHSKKDYIFKGANKELGIFTYQNDRMSAEAFNTSKQKLVDHLNSTNPHAGYALEHNQHFPFEIPANIDAGIRVKAEDQIGKSVANYYLNELPEAYGILYGQCDPSLRAALEEDDDFQNIHQKRDFLKLWQEVASRCLNPVRSDLNNHINVINRQQAARRKFEEFFQH